MNHIKQLLAQSKNNSIAEKCFEAFREEKVIGIKSTASMPIEHVKEIYSIREEINTIRGGKLKGYNNLLEKLQSTKALRAKVHLIKTEENNFGVFTNDEETQLFGVLLLRQTE